MGQLRRIGPYVLVLALLTACGSRPQEPTAAPATATAGAAAPTKGPAKAGGAITEPPAAGAGRPGLLPKGFPLPPGTNVGPVAVTGGQIAATLTIPDGKSGYDYWKSELPGAGYAVAEAQMVGGIGEITFSGGDCGSGSQLGISDRDVTLRCTR